MNEAYKTIEKPGNTKIADAFAELEGAMYAALETYSNVHRGGGHKSMASTYLFEQARDIVLEYLGLKRGKYVVIFCTPRREVILMSLIKPGRYKSVSSRDIGLPLGVRALAVEKRALPEGTPFETGGGTARLVSPGWVIWADAPDKFEAGTPSIINVIAFARALQLTKQYGNGAFMDMKDEKLTVDQILYNDDLEQYSGQKLLDELRRTMIGRGVFVPTVEGNKPFINLDNAASTPAFEPGWNVVRRTLRQPEKVYQEIVHEVRSVCAGILGAPLAEYDVIFTSNTTESINISAENLTRESGQEAEPVVLSTILEHTSNDLPWRMVPHVSMIRLPVNNEGFIDLNVLETLMCDYNQKGKHGKKKIMLVAFSGASNVLGICNYLEEISLIVHKYGAHLFVDGAQLVAHRKINMEQCGIDYLALSAHKVYAPFGTGVLVARKELLNFSPPEMDLIKSSGEENVAGIAALGKSLSLLQRIGLDLILEDEQVLTGKALHDMQKIPGLRVFGIKDSDSDVFIRKGGVIAFEIKGIIATRVARELAGIGGIGVRSGCHCAHILIKHLVGVPPALERFQGLIAKLFPELKFPGLVRVSFGIENSQKDVDTLIQVLGKIARKSQNLAKTDIKQQMKSYTMAAAQRVYSQL